MQKKFWVILLSVLIFLSGTVLGVSAVYRVDHVTVEASIVSEEAAREVQELREKLEKAYESESIFFANAAQAKSIVKEYPYFRIMGFEKAYPNRLIVRIAEGAEVYAVEKNAGQEYYVLGEDGVMLGVRDSHINALNGAENVILKGLNVTAEIGSMPEGDECFPSMLKICQKMSSMLGGIRSNVASVEVYLRTPETIYLVTMREGVKIYFGMPDELTEEKAEAAVNEYLSLTDEQKLTGSIVVSVREGKIFASYTVKDGY